MEKETRIETKDRRIQNEKRSEKREEWKDRCVEGKMEEDRYKISEGKIQ
jgi:hypothetical protein